MGLMQSLRTKLRGAPVGAPTIRERAASYMRGEASPFFVGWRPTLRDARDDVLYGYTSAAARAIDTAQNSGWIAGGVEQSISTTIGAGLRLNARPNAEMLGWDAKQASQWGHLVESRFEAWANDPVEVDMVGKHNFAQLQAQAIRQWFAYGEIVSAIPYQRRFGSPVGTKVQLIPAHRLTQFTDSTLRMIQGVGQDETGFPTWYRFQFRDANNFEHFVDMRARDALGRPNVVHIFDGNVGQMRGITPMAPVLRTLRQFDQLADATLTAALIQAIFAATVESEAPTDQVLQALSDPNDAGAGIGGGTFDDLLAARAGWYDGAKVDLGSAGKVLHMFPGEKLHFNASETPNQQYEAFAKFLLREIARGLNITFEQLTGDYTAATYSSVRMSTADMWQITTYRRSNIVGRFTQAAYEAWLEEQVELGNIEVPGGIAGFIANRAAICRADWRGPAKPQADDKKAAEAHQIWKTLGVMTDEMICNDLGVDYEDVYDQLAQEADMRDTRGIVMPAFTPPGSRPAVEPTEDERGDSPPSAPGKKKPDDKESDDG